MWRRGQRQTALDWQPESSRGKVVEGGATNCSFLLSVEMETSQCAVGLRHHLNHHNYLQHRISQHAIELQCDADCRHAPVATRLEQGHSATQKMHPTAPQMDEHQHPLPRGALLSQAGWIERGRTTEHPTWKEGNMLLEGTARAWINDLGDGCPTKQAALNVKN